MKKIAVFFEYMVFFLLLVVCFFSFLPKIPFFAQRSLNFYAVSSGSMEPTIKAGSVIYVSKFKSDELKNKDIITFLHRGADGKEVVVTHRIVKIENRIRVDKKKKIIDYRITTKGDANRTTDPSFISLDKVLGKYSFSIPYIGYLVLFAQRPLGFCLLVILPATILIASEVISIIYFFKNKFEEKTTSEIAKIKEELLIIKSKKKIKKKV